LIQELKKSLSSQSNNNKRGDNDMEMEGDGDDNDLMKMVVCVCSSSSSSSILGSIIIPLFSILENQMVLEDGENKSKSGVIMKFEDEFPIVPNIIHHNHKNSSQENEIDELILEGSIKIKIELTRLKFITNDKKNEMIVEGKEDHPMEGNDDKKKEPSPSSMLFQSSNLQRRNDINHHDQQISFQKKELEWERWRNNQELEWRSSLLEKESQLTTKLEIQYQKKEASRVTKFNQLKNQYLNLETNLRKGIEEVVTKENELNQQIFTMKRKFAQKSMELSLLQKQLVDTSKQERELEQNKIHNLGKENQFLHQQVFLKCEIEI